MAPQRIARNRLKRGIFLDRDGVINVCPVRRYISSWKEFRFVPGTLAALRTLARRGETVVVVSNQSGVGRGAVSTAELQVITRNMMRAIRRAGGRVQAVYYCPHRPEESCRCRKPKIGMLKAASRRFSIDLARSFVIGDHETDVRMGRAAGCRTVLVLSGRCDRAAAKRFSVSADRIAGNLGEAVRWILQRKGSR